MKSFALLVAAGAVLAQDLSSLPPCGQTCINNLLGLSPSFGCPTAEATCLCAEPNFGYGVRDCSNEACGNADLANRVISYGLAYCANALASASGPSASAVATGAYGILSSAAQSPAGVIASATDSSTLATITSSIASEASSRVSSIESSLASALSSVASDASSDASSIASEATSAISSATDAAGSAASSATNAPGAAPKMTGLPIVGAAGLAAWLLL